MTAPGHVRCCCTAHDHGTVITLDEYVATHLAHDQPCKPSYDAPMTNQPTPGQPDPNQPQPQPEDPNQPRPAQPNQ